MKFVLRVTSNLFALFASKLSVQQDINYPEEFCFNKNKIQNYFNEVVKSIKTNELLDDWTLDVRIYLGGALYDNCIGICKTGITYIKDKCREITIYISLPSSGEISWGFDKKRFKLNSIKNNKAIQIIPVEYSKYENMPDYIEENIKKSINELFLKGVTVKKIKFKI